MLYGNWLIAALLKSENGARDFAKLDPSPELFKGPEEELFGFVKAHLQKHGVIPSRDTIKKHLPDASVPEEPKEPPSYYYERMQNRHRHMAIKEIALTVADLLNADKVDEAEEIMADGIFNLRRTQFKKSIIDYAQDGYSLIKDHIVSMEKGYGMGIPFGWPSADKESLGMQPGDFISFIGRPGRGKTWMALYLMRHGWSLGHTPMFVSMEMAPQLIVQRFAALDTSTNATHIKMGTVQSSKKKQLYGHLLNNIGKPPVWIIDGGMNASVDDIALQVMEKKPDVLFIDGAYLLKAAGRVSRWEKIADSVESIKRDICEGMKIPTVGTYQFTREVAKAVKKGGKGVGLEGIAGADVVGQVSSIVFGMFDEDNVETMEKRRIEILKGRHGESGGFTVNWNFDVWPQMDFSEAKEETLEDLSNL